MQRLVRAGRIRVYGITLFVACQLLATAASGQVLTLKNGIQLKGEIGKLQSLNQNPLLELKGGGNVDVRKIVFVDNDLWRTFVSSNNVRTDGLAAGDDLNFTRIQIDKKIARSARRIGGVGPILQVTPFDEFGNRIFSMMGPNGRMDIVQGITEITPTYTKVEGLLVKNAYVWDMRLNTASIPRDILTKILLRQIDQTDPDDRLRVVRLYIQAQRYADALVELDRVIEDFPALKDLGKQRNELYQLVITDLIREIEFRRDAGQFHLAYNLLTNFRETGVAGELLLKVKDLLGEYDRAFAEAQRGINLLEGHVKDLEGHRSHEAIAAFRDEIKAEMNINNIDRLADYLRLADDEKLGPDQKVALAISGWLLGSGSGLDNLAEVLSLIQVRELVREYLRSENDVERQDILNRLKQLEGSTPGNVAKIIATMKPPIETQLPEQGVPNLLELSIPGLPDEPEFRYYIQLPPQYDPSRRYPCVVTLHGARTGPMDQIDWWAGPVDPTKPQELRRGQATRQGYVVLAPAWAKPNQTKYGYSLREHAAVLSSLRDACRRFSIDTDRTFLSGHSMGGDAAWDIALAHPDLWAGVIPITARADKYVSRYWKNAKMVPMYFVAGQLDANKIADNAMDLDRYMEKAGFDAMYVEYKGRGDEHFQDDILRIFDWMSRYRRQFAQREFEVTCMRPWDRFFWCVEMQGIPERFLTLPANWQSTGAKSAELEVRIAENNSIRIKSPAQSVTIWLSPEFIDLDKQVSFGRERLDVEPSVDVILWDVLTRGDRQHPFWASVTPNLGRRASR